MRTFVFNESNGNGSLIITDDNYEEALTHMRDLGLDPDHWECEDEEGEDDE